MGHRAVRVGNWKLVSDSDQNNDKWELYNLESDPYEQHNLAYERAEILDTLSVSYKHWAKELNVITIEERAQFNKKVIHYGLDHINY